MNGAGNDFIAFDKDEFPDLQLSPARIRSLCDRRYGIGADGIITVASAKDTGFVMEYFNADGSTGSLCGNGARCAIRFAEITGKFTEAEANFRVGETRYSGLLREDGLITFLMNPPTNLKYNFRVKAAGQLIRSHFADTGSPHLVIRIQDVLRTPNKPESAYRDINDFPVMELGRELRRHQDFAPGGLNVNFISVENDTVHIRTYERGVENETLACGTGSAAAAVIASVTDEVTPPVTLKTRGGDTLVVDFTVEQQRVRALTLTGPAEVNFTGEFSEHLFPME